MWALEIVYSGNPCFGRSWKFRVFFGQIGFPHFDRLLLFLFEFATTIWQITIGDTMFLCRMGLRSASRKRAPHDERCSSPLLHQAGSRLSKFPTWFSNTLDGFQLAAYSQGGMELSMSGGGESPMTTMNLSRIGHLSPQWEGLADICTLTPLPMAPPRPAPTSVTTLDRSGLSPCFSSQLIDPSCNGGSSATGHNHSLGKLLRRSPPRFRQPAARSPLNFKTQQGRCNQNQSLASTHLSQEHSQGGKHNALSINSSGEDDDIHDSLRCPEVVSPLQTTITKSGSPNQKRVNPPRQGGSLEQGPSKAGGGMVMSSSPGLRSSCKFTLQALPSLPPLTPPFSCSWLCLCGNAFLEVSYKTN